MSTIDVFDLGAGLQQSISSNLAWHYRVIPESVSNGVRTFYYDKNQNEEQIREELNALIGDEIELISAEKIWIQRNLGKFFRQASSNKEIKVNTSADFLDKIIQEANQLECSDIHVEIYEELARVRMRIDGHLIERYKIEKDEYPELINKIKIRSNLDISEKRLPQDGRIQYDDFDIRVSILPTLYGEKVVMRILGHDASSISINELGMSGAEKENYLEGVKRPNGIILISGPTGSGKTTTLYATLKLLNEEKRNIVTVEDPIEYTLEGVNQVQLKEDIGLTFTSALRSFLRQDPDVIMLGEIRDAQTAQMAIRAALTGHLVLSTIHTNSAWGTVSRLIDMGVPSFLVANTINSSVAQRLVRKLCSNCKEQQPLKVKDLPKSMDQSLAPENQCIPIGCETCHYTGYKGRQALYEIIPIDFELGTRIKNNDLRVEDYLRDKNFNSLADGALELLTNGITSLEEVYPILIEN